MKAYRVRLFGFDDYVQEYSVAFIDNQVVPSVEDMEGFNVLILSFYMSNGPSDQVTNWKNLPNDTRTQIVKDYHANNISIMMSVFGGDDTPTTNGTDPVAFAEEAANFVKEYQVCLFFDRLKPRMSFLIYFASLTVLTLTGKISRHLAKTTALLKPGLRPLLYPFARTFRMIPTSLLTLRSRRGSRLTHPLIHTEPTGP
jgi:hypothetical protein